MLLLTWLTAEVSVHIFVVVVVVLFVFLISFVLLFDIKNILF